MSEQPGSSISDSPYAAQLQQGFRALRFTRALERDFQVEYGERHLGRMRMGFAVATALYLVFLLVRLRAETGPMGEWGLLLRGVAIGAMLVTLAVSFWQRLRWVLPYCVIASYAILAIGMTAIEVLAQRYRIDRHYETLFLVSFHVYVFSGLLLRPALIAGGCIILSYLVGGWLGGLAGTDWGYQLLFIGLTHLIGVAGLYALEHVERDGFLRRRLLGVIATHDSLTGLYNRIAFFQHLERSVRQAARQRVAIGVVLLDIDHFKAFNDRYGHLEGDACLRTVARAIQDEFRRPLDAVARYGGEEFVGFWYDIQPQSLRSLADQLRATVQALRIPHQDSPSGRVTASVGAIACIPNEEEPVLAMVERADRALYEAKEKGRNRVVVEILAPAHGAARAGRRAPSIAG